MLSVGSVFSGAGLLDCGLALTGGFEHAWFCESDQFRRSILAKRFPGCPIVHDVREVGAATVQRVDMLAGGFPCRGASTAGKRDGLANDQTVLWHEMARAIRELQPRYCLVENVANILTMAAAPGKPAGSLWGTVLGDLAEIGYGIEWECLPAAAVGAPHLRDRVLAIATHAGRVERRPDEASCDRRRSHLASCGRPEGADIDRAGSDDAAANTDGAHERRYGDIFRIPRGRQDVGGDAQAAPDASRGRLPQQPQRHSRETCGSAGPSGHDVERRGLQVEWGVYGPAIQRWEAIHGPAPAPLTGVRRLDDGDTKLQRVRSRVDRSRLSALGDGVHVYIARLAGERILQLEAERMTVRERETA